MCGIAGQVLFNSEFKSHEILNKMGSYLSSRGPDAFGSFITDNIALTHRRLSIIDTTDEANQPMQDTNQTCVICFNGEIYNFQPLKKKLLELGYQFRTNSDTEVILNGYLAWGIKDLLKKLDGMFAFVLVDLPKKLLFACRDRFGKKPLYFLFNSEKFSFSSDIRSIWSTENNLTLDFESVDYYLTELSVPQPKTIWKEISQISPSCFILLDIKNWSINSESYWHLDFEYKLSYSEDEIEYQLEEKLKQAILKRTVADVPVSAFLSGGIDSGLIVSILASNIGHRLKTYSVGFTYEEYNELKNARVVANRYNTDHTEIILEADVLATLPKLIDTFGEPFADSSNIPTFLISKEISKDYKIALSGDGGDELFGGYDEYPSMFQMENYLKKYKGTAYREIATITNRIFSKFNFTKVNYGHFKSLSRMEGAMKLYRQMGFNPLKKNLLYSNESFPNHFCYNYLNDIWSQSKHLSDTDTLFAASIKTRLLNDYLVKVDRASMANSLEVRSPFLDYSLAEYAASIPNNLKLKGGIQKYLLKKLASKYIDPNIFARKKQGFGIPLEHWIRKDFKSYVTDLLLSEQFAKRQIFNTKTVQHIIKEHMESKADHTHEIWALVCLELWFQQFLD